MAVILAVNAGSSSLKTTLYKYGEDEKLRNLAKVEISSINQSPAQLKYSCGESQQKQALQGINDHKEAFEHILKAVLEDSNIPDLKKKEDIEYACHRVVHGGDFVKNELITRETFHRIEALEDLAPLHNASAVSLIRTCQDELPKVTNIACFDSSFHQTMPNYVKSYMIDQDIASKKGLRKYGFHGLSYAYIVRAVAGHLNKPIEETNIIACHLGSGASVCAIQQGKSIDTSMGLTPVSGLPGGSRSGDIDPALIFHYTSDASKLSSSSTKELHISTAEEILNKKSGWKALTGTSDFGEIARSDAPESHQMALDIFIDRITGYVGSYFVKLEGDVDAIVFAGGIGEKSALLRQRVIQNIACLGFVVNEEQNQNPAFNQGSVAEIGRNDEKKTLVCETDEDFEMAYSTMLNIRGK